MSGLRWKVCGTTNAADAAAAVDAGADALGFIFWQPSPRSVAVDDAAAIAAGVPDRVRKVGVFVDAPLEEITATAERVGLDIIQLHGDEPPDTCASLPLPVWKALRLASSGRSDDAKLRADAYRGCTLLVDAGVPGEYGGTGEITDWDAAARLAERRRVVLAGGLRADNVARAVEHVRPWGVDVASGVEAEPGRKDKSELRRFAAALEPYR